jgi:hypothetical protein
LRCHQFIFWRSFCLSIFFNASNGWFHDFYLKLIVYASYFKLSQQHQFLWRHLCCHMPTMWYYNSANISNLVFFSDQIFLASPSVPQSLSFMLRLVAFRSYCSIFPSSTHKKLDIIIGEFWIHHNRGQLMFNIHHNRL